MCLNSHDSEGQCDQVQPGHIILRNRFHVLQEHVDTNKVFDVVNGVVLASFSDEFDPVLDNKSKRQWRVIKADWAFDRA